MEVEASQIPPIAFVVFGLAWISGLAVFGCIFLMTRRLGMSWRKTGLSANLDGADSARIGKLLIGIERPPVDSNVQSLVWAIRGLWAAMVGSIILFAFLLAGAAS